MWRSGCLDWVSGRPATPGIAKFSVKGPRTIDEVARGTSLGLLAYTQSAPEIRPPRVGKVAAWEDFPDVGIPS